MGQGMRRGIRRQGEITADVKEWEGYSPDCAGEEGKRHGTEGESKEQNQTSHWQFSSGEKPQNLCETESRPGEGLQSNCWRGGAAPSTSWKSFSFEGPTG